MNNTRALYVIGAIFCLITLLYAGWVIQAQEQRWREFNDYVRTRDSRWEAYIYRTDASLKTISERLAVIGAKP